MTLGENMRQLRKARGLSQDEVARSLYLSRQSVSKWENDGAEPGVENLKGLSRLYGVTIDELVGNTFDETRKQEEGWSPEELYEGILGLRLLTALATVFIVEEGMILYCFDWLAMAVGCRVRNRLMWGVILMLEGASLFAHLILTVKCFWTLWDDSFIMLFVTAVNTLIFVLSCQRAVRLYFCLKGGSV